MPSVLVRRRVIRICSWVFAVLLLVAWAVSLAIDAPWTPWFMIALWAAIGIGFVVRIVRGPRGRRSSPDAFHDLNQIYLGRTQTRSPAGTSAETVEVGHPFPRPQPPSHRDDTNPSERDSSRHPPR